MLLLSVSTADTGVSVTCALKIERALKPPQQPGVGYKVTAGKLEDARGEGGGEEKGERERGIQGVGQQPAVLSGIELVADRIPRGVNSRSIEGVEACVLSPATVALVSARAVQTSRKEAFGLAATTRDDVLHGPRLVHAGIRLQTFSHTQLT